MLNLVVRKETDRPLKVKVEAADNTVWRSDFGRGYCPVVRQETDE
jgi:hypothetical protein